MTELECLIRITKAVRGIRDSVQATTRTQQGSLHARLRQGSRLSVREPAFIGSGVGQLCSAGTIRIASEARTLMEAAK